MASQKRLDHPTFKIMALRSVSDPQLMPALLQDHIPYLGHTSYRALQAFLPVNLSNSVFHFHREGGPNLNRCEVTVLVSFMVPSVLFLPSLINYIGQFILVQLLIVVKTFNAKPQLLTLNTFSKEIHLSVLWNASFIPYLVVGFYFTLHLCESLIYLSVR